MSIIERLRKINNGRGFVFTAIETLEKEEEIKQFYDEYVEWQKWLGFDEQKAVKRASDDIGYTLGYYTRDKEEKWWKALPEVKHPIFGRLTSVSPDDAFKAGKIAAEKGFETAKEYIKNKYKC